MLHRLVRAPKSPSPLQQPIRQCAWLIVIIHLALWPLLTSALLAHAALQPPGAMRALTQGYSDSNRELLTRNLIQEFASEVHEIGTRAVKEGGHECGPCGLFAAGLFRKMETKSLGANPVEELSKFVDPSPSVIDILAGLRTYAQRELITVWNTPLSKAEAIEWLNARVPDNEPAIAMLDTLKTTSQGVFEERHAVNLFRIENTLRIYDVNFANKGTPLARAFDTGIVSFEAGATWTIAPNPEIFLTRVIREGQSYPTVDRAIYVNAEDVTDLVSGDSATDSATALDLMNAYLKEAGPSASWTCP